MRTPPPKRLPTLLPAVVAHELRLLYRDRTLVVIAVLLAAAVFWGVRTGETAATSRSQLAEEAVRDEARIFADFELQARPTEALEVGSSGFDPATNAGILASFYPRIAVLPPADLAALSIGQSDVYPPYFRVTAERRDSFLDATELANPLHLLVGAFDLSFVVVYILPLFLVLLSHDMLAAERGSGTLAQVMAQPIRLRTVILGKVIARAFPIALLVALTMLAIGLEGGLATSDGWLRLGLWAALVTGYGLFWLGLGASLDRLGQSPATNAVALACLWLTLLFVAPAAAQIAVSRFAPIPPRTELAIATRDAETRSRRPVELLRAYYREHPDRYPTHPDFDVNVYDFPLYWFAIQREVDRLMHETLAAYDRAVADRRSLVSRVQAALPPVLAQESLNDLAGTGQARHRRFLQQVEAFHREHIAFFEPLIVSKTDLRREDYARMPRFVFVEEPSRPLALRVGGKISILWELAVALLALACLRRSRSPIA